MTKYAKCSVCGYAIAIPDDKNSSDYVCPNDGNTLIDATEAEYDANIHIKGPYSAIVYKDGSSVYAEDANGTTIAEGEAGVDDASVIQSALDSLTDGRTWKERVVSLGEFNISAWINVPSHAILEGGRFTGSGGFKIENSYVEVRNIEASFDASHNAAFKVWVPADSTLTDIRFYNVRAIDCGRHGFLIDAPYNDGQTYLKNVEFISCKAINCGRYSRYNDWIVGFDFVEHVSSIENLKVIGCEASGCWESGFHMEDAPRKYKVVIANSVGYDNGQKPSPVYGCGFLVSGELTMVGCKAIENGGDGIKINNNDIEYPVNIDVLTENNGRTGVIIQKAKNVVARVNSMGDKWGLDLKTRIDSADITVVARDSDEYAILTTVAASDWSEKFSNIALKATITDPGGAGGLATLFQRFENFHLDINYYNSQHTLSHGAYFRRLRHGVIDLNVNVSSGTGVSMFCEMSNVKAKGFIKAVDQAIYLYDTTGGLRLGNLQLFDATTGINAAGSISNVIIDLRTIEFENVTHKLGGTAVSNLTIKDKNFGMATISNGNSSVTVNHGLARAPEHGVRLTGTHSEVANCWVTDITNTQFTINAPANVTADRDVYWIAEV